MIRAASERDHEGVAAVATAHEIAGFDSVMNPRYQALLREHGRLVVAVDGGEVVGFGGMIVAVGVAMITDLFVLESAHGRGFGTRMTAALLDGFPRRMTFSSRHPAARATYARAGMEPQWFLRYLRGSVSAHDDGPMRAVDVTRGEAVSDRPELVQFFAESRMLHLVEDGEVRGHAIVRDTGPYLAIDRLMTDAAHDEAMAAVMRTLPIGSRLEACVPEPSAAYAWLLGVGFTEVEYDLHMASESGLMPPGAVALNPGLA